MGDLWFDDPEEAREINAALREEARWEAEQMRLADERAHRIIDAYLEDQ